MDGNDKAAVPYQLTLVYPSLSRAVERVLLVVRALQLTLTWTAASTAGTYLSVFKPAAGFIYALALSTLSTLCSRERESYVRSRESSPRRNTTT